MVFANALWIVGLSILLTTLSLAHWFGNQQGQSLRRILAKPAVRLLIAFSLIWFALGLLLLVEPWWYKMGWVVIIILSIWEGLVAWQQWQKRKG